MAGQLARLALPGRRYRGPLAAFGAVWLAAVAYLSVRGEWRWVQAAAGEAVLLAVFVALTVWATPPDGDAARHRLAGPDTAPLDPTPPDPTPPDPATPRVRLAAQLAAGLLAAVLAVLRFHDIPLWGPFVSLLYDAANAVPVPRPNYLVNPVIFALLPLAAVLALGAGRAELGFRGGHRAWRVSALWTAPVLVVWLVLLMDGATTAGRIGRVLLSNLFQNGFGEEVLWRGIIQTRIARLWTPEWGLVLAALGFGWWHIDSIHDWVGTDLLLAAALNVTVQAPMGLALGVVFQRTRSLLAPTMVHTVANSVAV